MITITAAAAIAGKSPTLIRRAMREGKITGEKITSRMWLVDEASLKEWISQPHQRGNPKWIRRNMEDQTYTMDGVREDANEMVDATHTKTQVVEMAKNYYRDSAVKIEGKQQDVIDAFLMAWQEKKDYCA